MIYCLNMEMNTLHYTIILRPEPEGGFTVNVPALPGCVTYGKDLDEAQAMAEDVIKGYIASLRKHNEPVPSDARSLVASVELPAQYASSAF